MMDNLTPTARLALEALQDGPGNVHELRERIGRSRSATDKAINELAKANLIVKVEDGGDPADGAPTRWQLCATTMADDNSADRAAALDDSDVEGGPALDGTEPADDGAVEAVAQAAEPLPTTADSYRDAAGEPESGEQSDQTPEPGAVTDPGADDDSQEGAGEPPKLCRGCKNQMPQRCECCWQKTPAFCGTSRRNMPEARRGEPGEPVILSNGLVKLRPGELEKLVENVIRDNPLPAHVGVVGWTPGRVGVFLPGRSLGAIRNALVKLNHKSVLETIDGDEERYRLPGTVTDADADTDSEEADEQTGRSDGDSSTAVDADAVPHPVVRGGPA